ncbi:hypothetical protein EV363DRAFT_1326646 [Boletus edulis]|uniref:Uncharacterized protein n=1 Tax=Boletus edulis BED1 TaxID=1328754 RepID=A0AAD4BP37_BOLED|nr:hypothetical protein EV363DRAFT_1326646 [Boletus edulis]KAF8436260.1 hypothetical protein L210DRAFT_3549197 [Boletus edulis BED1]
MLKNGYYLIRRWIITLLLATMRDGAEFHSSYTQVNIGDDQFGIASASEELTFPGGYSDSNPIQSGIPQCLLR